MKNGIIFGLWNDASCNYSKKNLTLNNGPRQCAPLLKPINAHVECSNQPLEVTHAGVILLRSENISVGLAKKRTDNQLAIRKHFKLGSWMNRSLVINNSLRHCMNAAILYNGTTILGPLTLFVYWIKAHMANRHNSSLKKRTKECFK